MGVARRSGLEWLRARDPGLAAVRRSARVTVVACTGFYAARYGLGDRTVAIYALFGAVAAGGLSSVPGSPRERARTLMAALPVGMALVTLGTVLAAHAWTAALGMLVVGFLVTFSGVGGPKLVGLANGLQLFYILPCFPPYAPSTLGHRLAGLVAGVVLIGLAECFLWPAPCPARYEQRVARAARTAAETLYGLAADPPRRGDPDALLKASQELRMSHVPTDERPASASARDRALSEAASQMRHLLAQTWQLTESAGEGAAPPEPAAMGLLLTSAAACEDVDRALTGRAPPPMQAVCGAAASAFESHRVRPRGTGTDSATMVRNGAIALDITHTADFVVTAVRIVLGARVPADGTPLPARPGAFWYAGRPTAELYYHRLRAHLTPRSVYFQNAVRIAVALAAVRLVVGALGLEHGFWALLTTLTVMRTSAVGTRTALMPALRGTLAGAVVAALILYFAAGTPLVFAALLPPCMLLAFASGKVLGPGWGQAFFTLTVAAAFTQIAPSGPELAAARFLDVLTGAVTGAVVGLLAWPHGGTGELRRACARVLDQGTRAVADITERITEGARATDALPRARLAQLIVEATYAQYATERHDARHAASGDTDFQVIMLAGNRVITMGQVLLDNCPPGALSAWPLSAAHLRDAAHRLRGLALPFSYDLILGRERAFPENPHPDDAPTDRTVIHDVCTASAGGAPDPLLYYAVDAAIWLASLQAAIAAARPASREPATAGPD
ncbi:FUSC family protein [Streptomyces sp. NPDC088733]|uniref:FUSC family protein n=1 Tax=Streptomyces sp. NPDC088733 TaxID=3365880 RepID=UPI0038053884